MVLSESISLKKYIYKKFVGERGIKLVWGDLLKGQMPKTKIYT